MLGTLTLEEAERRAYADGDVHTAKLLGLVLEALDALEAAEELRELEDT